MAMRTVTSARPHSGVSVTADVLRTEIDGAVELRRGDVVPLVPERNASIAATTTSVTTAATTSLVDHKGSHPVSGVPP
jgi:hypothetical protein